MSYEPKPGEITIFRNTYKQAGDNKPDYTGSFVNERGEKCKLAGWIKKPKNGGPSFISGRVEFSPYGQDQAGESDQTQEPSVDEIQF